MKHLEVLLVEDEATNREVAELILRSAGHRVTSCVNGREALAQLAARPGFDAIVMDLLMPELDGLSATRAIKAEPATAGIPILIVSARASTSDRTLGLAAGADGYLTKPFRRSELLGALADAVAIRGRLPAGEAKGASGKDPQA